LREHWQLNVDMFGLESIYAEVELISIAYSLMRNFGLSDDKFEIRVNDRKLLNAYFEELGLDHIQANQFSRLLDKKNKIPDFDEQAEKLVGKKVDLNIQPNETITTLLDSLRSQGIANVVFDPTLMRGFDYYTGVVFEVYDTGKENRRALFGGGRYDDLLDIFGAEKVPAVGFGKGDVTMRDMLETYSLLPEYKPEAQIALCPLNDAFFEATTEFATNLRLADVNVIVDYTGKKVGDMIKNADRRKIPYVAIIGEDEVRLEKFKVKNLLSGQETSLALPELADFLNKK
jgi:histidyl-tRNA synthetase